MSKVSSPAPDGAASGGAPIDPAAPASRVQVRVLLDCDIGVADAVVELSAQEAAARAAAGQVDPHPDAVAYALQLRTPPADQIEGD